MRRLAAATAVVTSLLVLRAPAVVAQQRDRDTLQSELELARATDMAVEQEAARLGQQADVERSALADAESSEAAARQRAEVAARNLQEVEGRAATARLRLGQVAVDAYVHPSGQGGLMLLARAGTFDEAVRRKELAGLVSAHTADVLEVYRGVQQDREMAKAELTRSSEVASERSAEQRRRTLVVELAEQEQRVAHDELQRRITNLEGESQALAAEDARLRALLSRPAPLPATGVLAPTATPSARSSSGMIWPLDGPVTSEFGPRWGSFHSGIDISDPEGTPIAAALAGSVVFAGDGGGYGNLVVIDHGGGLATAYAHQSRIGVDEGQSVSQGETIGYVGSTGHSTGNHLHFEVREDGVARNPRGYL
jgi:murein DD-endopeptidase MepM/ murein hydrolase activator NlpD